MEKIEEILHGLLARQPERDESIRRLNESRAKLDETLRRLQAERAGAQDKRLQRLTVNKRTHRIRFDNETEDQVTIVIERREEGEKK